MNFGTEIIKRILISQSSKIFDPLGLISPYTVMLKVFYQRLWLLKLEWDAPLPKEWIDKLRRFQEEFKTLSDLKISRWLHATTKSTKKRMSAADQNMLPNSSFVPPSTSGRQAAMKLIIKLIQVACFQNDLKLIRINLSLNPKSVLSSLSPFFDNDGILRVGGRLQNSDLAFNGKHPIIIPGEHKFAFLLVTQYRITYMHSGSSLLANILKQKDWIVKGKKLIRSFIHKCHRYKLSSNSQLMGSLPKQRVTLERTFLRTGIDYAGPVILNCYNA
ncbi:hypothetical protein HNY73_023247 [Argiope bruennichi]|uniref:Integrase zinc-binding domain-containing protein n=1 Tax=Argiope bruennichi TaxID=94029 RepID=A0A8T0E4K5_ARGBR|nr:hypothetical protein HNY73_023247 [Argiope bruennichi]